MGADMEVVVGMHTGQSHGGWPHVRRCQNISFVLMTPDHTVLLVNSSGRVKLELVGLPGRTLAQDKTRMLLFVVNAAGWLHSMVLHGCSSCDGGDSGGWNK